MARQSKAKFTMKGHSIPGIKGFKDSSPKDGRATSSPYQMAQPGDSPLQKGFLGKALNVMTGGAAGAIGQALKGNWKGAGKSLMTGGMASFGKGGLGGGDAGGGGGSCGGAAEQIKAEAKEELKQDIASPAAMKSPTKIYDEGGKRRKNYKY